MVKHILVVNPNVIEAEKIKSRMGSSTTNVVCAYTIQQAIQYFDEIEFCLVILDANISASDDHTLLRAMRKVKTMPILVLSSHNDHSERIHAFQAGAHAYMGKPYTEEECLAQAHTLMQLYMEMHPENDDICYTLAFGKDLIIEPDTRQVMLNGKQLKMTRKEFDLLLLLASNAGRVFSCDQLYDQVWDDQAAFNVEEVVKYHIKSLRKKLMASDTEYIHNVWGIGYRFEQCAAQRR